MKPRPYRTRRGQLQSRDASCDACDGWGGDSGRSPESGVARAVHPPGPPRHLRTRSSDLETLEQVRDEGSDGAALAAGEGDVREQRVALERLDHRGDAVVPPDSQVVPLGDVVG